MAPTRPATSRRAPPGPAWRGEGDPGALALATRLGRVANENDAGRDARRRGFSSEEGVGSLRRVVSLRVLKTHTDSLNE